MSNKHISLTLTPEASNMLARLSSDEAESLIYAYFTPWDLFLTYFFRYPRLISHDIGGNPSNGPAIDYVANDPWLAGLITLAIGGFAAINFYKEYNKVKRAKNNNSNAYIYGYMTQEERDFRAMLDAEVEGKTKNTWFNEQITKIINSDPKLRRTYKSIKIEGAGVNTRIEIELPSLAEHAAIEKAEKKAEQEDAQRRAQLGAEQPPSLFREIYNGVVETEAFKDFKEYILAPIGEVISFINKKVLAPLWEMACISAFTYWLLFIGASLFSHSFGTVTGLGGIEGLGNFAFGIPLAVGFVYPLYKMARWVVNKLYPPSKSKNLHQGHEATDKEVLTAEQEASSVLRRVFMMKRFALAKYRMTKEIVELGHDKNVELIAVNDNHVVSASSVDDQLNAAVDSGVVATAKTVSAFGSDAVNTYIWLQYIAWIVTDMISVARKIKDIGTAIATNVPIINTIFGWAFLAMSVAHGMYTAAKSLITRNDYNDQVRALNAKIANAGANLLNLEEKHSKALQKVNALKLQLVNANRADDANLPDLISHDQPQFFNDITRKGATNWTKLKKWGTRALTLINGITTGMFLLRLFLVKNTAIFLPTVLAVSLSNPVTIGLVVGLGVAYGLYKLHEYHVKRKEEQARDLLAKRSERIETLRERIETLNTAARLLEARLENPQGREAFVANNKGGEQADASYSPLFGPPVARKAAKDREEPAKAAPAPADDKRRRS